MSRLLLMPIAEMVLLGTYILVIVLGVYFIYRFMDLPRRRARGGQCWKCGYIIREGGRGQSRCPECGWVRGMPFDPYWF